MRQVGDYCGNKVVGASWRRAAGFLFRNDRLSRNLIADLLRMTSAAIGYLVLRDWCVFVEEKCMNARPDPISVVLIPSTAVTGAV